jgi:hypothetical protein
VSGHGYSLCLLKVDGGFFVHGFEGAGDIKAFVEEAGELLSGVTLFANVQKPSHRLFWKRIGFTAVDGCWIVRLGK